MLRALLFLSILQASLIVAPIAWAQSSDRRLRDALEQPLRDLSVIRAEIPEVLRRAAIAPYADAPTLPSGALDCVSVTAEIEALSVALGPNVEGPMPEASLMAEARTAAGNAVFDAVGDLVELPYRGVIRRLTGVERRDRERRDAVQAGMVRRGYLLGMSARECALPQLQSAFDPEPEAPLSDLQLARLQLAAANAAAEAANPAAAAASDLGLPASAPEPNATASEASLSAELERARRQLAAENAPAPAAVALGQ